MTRWLYPGHGEGVKTAAHVTLGSVATLCAGYNLCAFVLRRQPHLGVNAVAYSLLVALEVAQIRLHCERRCR